MGREVFVKSEQPLTSDAVEVIRAILKGTEYEGVTFTRDLGTFNRALVFGRMPEGERHGAPTQYVYTYSLAQLMTKPNAASVLLKSLELYFEGHTTVPDLEQFAGFSQGEYFDAMFDYDKPVFIDIETNGVLGKDDTVDDVSIISMVIYQPGVEPVCVVGTEQDGIVQPIQDGVKDAVADLILKFSKPVYHNGKFDTRVMNRVFGKTFPVWADTMLMNHTLNHASGEHGLKALCMRYFNAPDWDRNAKKYTAGGKSYSHIPIQELAFYNLADAVYTSLLYEYLMPQIEADEDKKKCLYFEMKVSEFLLEVEMNGIPINEEYMESYSATLTEQSQSLTQELNSYIRSHFKDNELTLNCNSPKQVKDFYNNYLHTPLKSTNKETLEGLVEDPDTPDVVKHVSKLILLKRGTDKKRSTYCEGWGNVVRNGRVHPTFLVHGTATGRLSSRNPNAQNMPREKEVRYIVGVK